MPAMLGSPDILAFLRDAGDRVPGDLVIVGGAAVATWLDPRRRTEDIDVFHATDRAGAQLALWDLAAARGLPIEAVNGAAEYFVRRIPGWDLDLEPVVEGAAGRVLRPSPTVFLLTKITRLSERDLLDCRLVLRGARRGRFQVDRARVLSALDQLPRSDDQALESRRASVRRSVERLRGGKGTARP